MAKCYACSFGFSSLEMMTPILIRLVLDFVSDRQHNTLYGIALVVAVVVSRLLICLFDCHSSFHFVNISFTFLESNFLHFSWCFP